MRIHGIPVALVLASIIIAMLCLAGTGEQNSIRGIVRDEAGPVVGAIVRIQTTEQYVKSDSRGRFVIAGLSPGKPVRLTAWAPGYYIAGGTEFMPGEGEAELVLTAHSSEDHADYQWLPARKPEGDESGKACSECHGGKDTQLPFTLPFDEWRQDAHSRSVANIRFLTMYAGTDVQGNKSSPAQYMLSREYGRMKIPRDRSKSYFGPGYKLDFPETAGNCGACHVPLAAVNSPFSVDPGSVSGVAAEGVSCDFCHKVWDVQLDPDTGLPFPNMPGVLSFEFRRPPAGHQFFAGPLDDVAPGEDAFSPLQRESRFCAPCHFAVFWDTVIYNSFGEWLESPYSDPETGKTCQDCHMPHIGATYFVRPDKGGLQRDPATIFSHRMPGAEDKELLQNAVALNASARREGTNIIIEVVVTNDRTGHHVPTDSPLRQMILLIIATDADGNTLKPLEGPIVPEWGGVGDPGQGYYAGLPGKIFAKILEELWTKEMPTGAYWNHTLVVEDNRLAAFDTDITSYVFDAPAKGSVTVEVTLFFRRAFKELMDQKGWTDPDIIMAREEIILPAPAQAITANRTLLPDDRP